jgi:hypothetical protein
MGGAANTDSLVGNDVNRSSWLSKTMILIAAQIHLVVSTGNSQCLGQLSRTRAKSMYIMDVPSPPHQRNPASWLKGTDENKTVFPSFHQDIQHPVNAVIEINIRRRGSIPLDERARTRAHEAMTRFIADCVVGFGFDDYASARIPTELAPDEITGAAERVALEKISPQHFAPPGSHYQLAHPPGL